MKPAPLDTELNDFLDDRMSAEERAAFEARLEREPELARRVRAERERPELLREETEPSPGFYTRARARFEESRGKRRGWSRALSWEAVGLAAAAGLAAVAFGPLLLRGELVPEGPRTAPPPEAIRADRPAAAPDLPSPPPPRSTDRSEAVGRVGAVLPGDPAAPRREKLALSDFEQQAETEPPQRFAPEPKKEARPATPGRSAELSQQRSSPDEKAGAAAPPPAKQDAFRDTVRRQEAAGEREEADVSLDETGRRESSMPPTATTKRSPAEDTGRRDRREGLSSDDARSLEERFFAPQPGSGPPDGALAKNASLAGPRRLVLRGIELPAGVVPPATVRIVDTEHEWRALLDGPAAAVFPARQFDEQQRLVLLGARAGIASCSLLIGSVEPTRYLILPPADAGPTGVAPEGGCAVFLPRDGRVVVVDDGAP